MAIGFKPMPKERQPYDTLLWELVKDARRLVAYLRKIDRFDALELRYDINGRFLASRMYRGAECAQLKPDAETKRQESLALGWLDPEEAVKPAIGPRIRLQFGAGVPMHGTLEVCAWFVRRGFRVIQHRKDDTGIVLDVAGPTVDPEATVSELLREFAPMLQGRTTMTNDDFDLAYYLDLGPGA